MKRFQWGWPSFDKTAVWRWKDSTQYNKMKSYIQILTTPTVDTPGTTLLLHFDNKRYLIGNIAEGTQRACIQMGTRMLKISDVLLTGKSEWSNHGGLLGMMLTLADAASSSATTRAETERNKSNKKVKEPQDLDPHRLNLYGPPNLNHMLATARNFVFRKGMPIYANELKDIQPQFDENRRWLPTFADSNIRVWAMAIKPKASDPIPPAPLSPRKRSHDEANSKDVPPNAAESETDAQRTDRYDQIRKGVVANMFNSTWRLDALTEMPLSEVKLPATLFYRNPETKQTEKYTGPLPGGEQPVPDIKVLVRAPWPGALVARLPPSEPAPEAISYIICNYPQRGKFLPEKAKQLVQEKSKWAKLTKGESVQNEKGETITPDMVLGPGKTGGGVAVVELPSVQYVHPLVEREEWSSKDVMEGVGAVIWILGAGVAASPELQQFMKDTGHLEHIISSRDVCPNRLSMDSAAASAIKLSQVDFGKYAVPAFDNETTPQRLFNTPNTPATQLGGLSNIATPADRGMIINLEPSVSLDTKVVIPPLDTVKVLAESSPTVKEIAQQAKAEIDSDPEIEAWKKSIPSADAEIITLGTGSALPSKYRNVSATLMRVPGHGNYLFDAGENTLGQLQRVYKPDELVEVLRDLRMIWISHLHADHHLGTVSVIKAWYEIVHNAKPSSTPISFEPSRANGQTDAMIPRRLAVISEAQFLTWLSEYSHVEDYGYSRVLPLSIKPNDKWGPSTLTLHHSTTTRSTSSSITGASSPPSSSPPTDRVSSPRLLPSHLYPLHIGLSDIQSVRVLHCHGAMAVSLTFPNTFKVSYSGDCRPSLAFSDIGKGSTVLIHEATFDDELKGEAVAKKHSTTGEALKVGEVMGVKGVVLTHFSQRYQKIPVMDTVGAGVELEDVDAEREEELLGVVVDGGATAAAAGSADSAMLDAPSDASFSNGVANGMTDPAKPSDGVPAAVARDPVARVKTKARDMKVCVAFDYMRVKVGEIAAMEKLAPALVELFREEEGERGGAEGGGVFEEKEGGEDGGERMGTGKKGEREREKVGRDWKARKLEKKRSQSLGRRRDDGGGGEGT
ncbi:hypothetical protein LTS18_006177 [Coniosporium uncinatum]|uniref:Uncharacterized protein n=1 Tax=Coniosporium uncinatum TaxID=93489 RepID=A0ACC3DDC3_9PEZI|nr:hypothetical protein LTS18_006177 [Coniosporium uncinatum]